MYAKIYVKKHLYKYKNGILGIASVCTIAIKLGFGRKSFVLFSNAIFVQQPFSSRVQLP